MIWYRMILQWDPPLSIFFTSFFIISIMPWLIQSTESQQIPLSQHLFFVHVPRCGGTSLMQHFNIPNKVIYGKVNCHCHGTLPTTRTRTVLGKLAMKYFFMRYHTLETANFPIYTRENGLCLALLLMATALQNRWLGALAVTTSLFTTIVCTAPVIGRIALVHRWYLWFVHYPLMRAMESIDWCTGTNKHGYIMHLTAPKLLGYGYITPKQLDEMCSLAIVRNPYTRMVSIYGYNRFSEAEKFSTFVKRWKHLMRHYIERGEKEEWYTPCHVLPQFEYTHHNGKQIVQSVVKQEELKLLKTRDGAKQAVNMDTTISDLPDLVREALLGMPHVNSRNTSQKWYDYFDQDTLDLTYEMYRFDFEVFGYDTSIKERPDLRQPRRNRRDMFHASKIDRFNRNSFMGSNGIRISQLNLFHSVKKSVVHDAMSKSSKKKQSLVALDKENLLASGIGIHDYGDGINELMKEDGENDGSDCTKKTK